MKIYTIVLSCLLMIGGNVLASEGGKCNDARKCNFYQECVIRYNENVLEASAKVVVEVKDEDEIDPELKRKIQQFAALVPLDQMKAEQKFSSTGEDLGRSWLPLRDKSPAYQAGSAILNLLNYEEVMDECIANGSFNREDTTEYCVTSSIQQKLRKKVKLRRKK